MGFALVGRGLKRRTAVAAGVAAVAALAVPAGAGAAPTGLFVGNYDGTTISQFTIGAGGLLSPNGTAPTGSGSWNVAASPDGKYLYASNNRDGDVTEYAIGANGTLTALSPATIPAGSRPEQVAVSPDGKNAYVASSGSSAVYVYDITSGGQLSQVGTVTSDLQGPTGLAISPDGSSVYVADGTSDNIVEFDRSSNGSLTPKPTAILPTTLSGDLNLVITPDGKYVYATGGNSTLIGEYSVGAEGELAPQPTASIGEGSANYQLTVSPSGSNLYAAGCPNSSSPGLIYEYSIGSAGELAPLTPATVAAGGNCPQLQWMTANGQSLYAPDLDSSDVSQFSVSSAGVLSLKTPPTVPAGASPDDVVIAPDQGPVAAFSSKAATTGRATKFDGSQSTDSDGTVASYQWSFGDGASKTTTSPTVAHTYKKAGKHKVTLTVTDDSGCSTTQVFTGQTAYCNGTPAAQSSHTVKINRPLKLSVSPRHAKAGKRTCYALKATSNGHRVSRVKVKLAGHKATTSRHGKAKLCLRLKKGRHTARASKSGYATATTKIKIAR